MTIPDIESFVRNHLPGTDVLSASGDAYFYYDPERSLPHDKRFPYATIMTTDAYDYASDLSRPDVFRLNLGVTRETYQRRFGPPPPKLGGPEGVDTGHDYKELNRIMPHPVYAAMSWVCILQPDDIMEAEVQALLQEAHALAARSFTGRAARRES